MPSAPTRGRRAQRHPGPALRDRRVRRVGIIAGFAGCVLAAKLRIGQANVGLDYLLPALVGAFLGSTTIKPGRVNVWGTMCGVLILAVGISGIQQLGGAFFVEPLFNGTTLVISIALPALRSAAGLRSRPRPIRSDRPPWTQTRVQPPRPPHARGMPAAPEAAAACR